MHNYVKFPVRCRRNPHKTETLYVYYLRDDDGWFPLPPIICDNGCGLHACNTCTQDVWEKSKTTHPLTQEEQFRKMMAQFL